MAVERGMTVLKYRRDRLYSGNFETPCTGRALGPSPAGHLLNFSAYFTANTALIKAHVGMLI